MSGQHTVTARAGGYVSVLMSDVEYRMVLAILQDQKDTGHSYPGQLLRDMREWQEGQDA